MSKENNNIESFPPKTMDELLNLPKDLKMSKEDAVYFLEKIYDALSASVEIGSETPKIKSFFNHREIYENRISIAHGILGRYVVDNQQLQEYASALNALMRNQTGSQADMRIHTKEKHEPISEMSSPIGIAMKHTRSRIQKLQEGN